MKSYNIQITFSIFIVKLPTNYSNLFLLALGLKARLRQNYHDQREELIALGADPVDTPEGEFDADSYSVWSDMSATTRKTNATTATGTTSGNVYYDDESTIYADENSTVLNDGNLDDITEEDFKDLTSGDFDHIQFPDADAPEFDHEIDWEKHDGSSLAPNRK